LRRRLKASIVEFVKKYSIDHWLRDLAQSEGVDMRFVANRFSETRQFDEKGEKIYTLWDIYPHARHTCSRPHLLVARALGHRSLGEGCSLLALAQGHHFPCHPASAAKRMFTPSHSANYPRSWGCFMCQNGR
jgi:hypothetical protein